MGHAAPRLVVFAVALLCGIAPGCLQILGDEYETRGAPAPPPTSCDDIASCEDCISCAIDEECGPEAAACYSGTPCGDYLACNSQPGCESFSCDAECMAQHPEGSATFDELIACTDEVCVVQC
jgi:hypothetical protein